MRAITTIFLSNTLSEILKLIEEIPDLDPDYPALVELRRTLVQRVQEHRNEDSGRIWISGYSGEAL